MIRRREFIAGLGAAGWPLVARAQQRDRLRRVGVLMGWSEADPEYRSILAAFVHELARLGWSDGGNVRIDQRWTDAQIDRTQAFARELVELNPDVIVCCTSPVTAALQRETRTIPIVFTVVTDPVAAGFVTSLSRPAGNITGFISSETTMGGKWLNLLKECQPRMRRAAIMFNPDTAASGVTYFLESFETAARSLAVDPITVHVRNDADIDSTIIALGREQAGLVLLPDSFLFVRRGAIISSAVRNKVPTIFDAMAFARDGGFISYGPNFSDIFRRAAGYVDRILRGDKPTDLPVAVPIKFELLINLRTAKVLDIEVPPNLLALADEVIE